MSCRVLKSRIPSINFYFFPFLSSVFLLSAPETVGGRGAALSTSVFVEAFPVTERNLIGPAEIDLSSDHSLLLSFPGAGLSGHSFIFLCRCCRCFLPFSHFLCCKKKKSRYLLSFAIPFVFSCCYFFLYVASFVIKNIAVSSLFTSSLILQLSHAPC